LIAGHLGNYAELLKGEAKAFGMSVGVRAAGAAMAFVALLLALGLTGVAVMLGVLNGSFHWILALVPGVAWLLALGGGLLALKLPTPAPVDDVKDELERDLRALRLVQEAKND
tara:strand:- start:1448 stop:1786 length:339 start_codon:yes stop_codon:yes gene_type:complete